MDLRKRPWKVLRVVVEVTVPNTSRADEGDLAYLVESGLSRTLKLPRPIHDNAHEAVVRVKQFNKFWPMFRLKQKKEGTDHG